MTLTERVLLGLLSGTCRLRELAYTIAPTDARHEAWARAEAARAATHRTILGESMIDGFAEGIRAETERMEAREGGYRTGRDVAYAAWCAEANRIADEANDALNPEARAAMAELLDRMHIIDDDFGPEPTDEETRDEKPWDETADHHGRVLIDESGNAIPAERRAQESER